MGSKEVGGLPIKSSSDVRTQILDALRLDLIGPRPSEVGHGSYTGEMLPVTPSKWYLARTKAKSLSPIAKTFLHYVETEGKKLLLDEMAAAR